MDAMECQFHGNCGGWCETDEERGMCLCSDCLDAYHEAEEQQKHVTELEKAMQRIACAAGIELAQPGEIADQVCARLQRDELLASLKAATEELRELKRSIGFRAQTLKVIEQADAAIDAAMQKGGATC